MGRIPKRNQKKTTKNNTFEAQWKIFNEGENFELLVDGKDISESVEALFLDDKIMIAWDNRNKRYYYLGNPDEMENEVLYDCYGVQADDGAIVVTFNGFDDYYFLIEGNHEAFNSTASALNNNFAIWSNTQDDFYVAEAIPKDEDFVFMATRKLNNQTGFLWLKEEDDSFFLNVRGDNKNEQLFSFYAAANLLVIDTKEEIVYLFEGFSNLQPNSVFEAKSLSIPSNLIWLKTENNNYKLIENGQNLHNSLDMKASYYMNDVIVYRPDNHTHYLLKDFRFAPDGAIDIPQELPNNTEAIWIKPEHNKFKLFLMGQDLTDEVNPKLMGNDLFLPHPPTGKVYCCVDYKLIPTHQFTPSVPMDLSDFPG
jgi:hypothetical protein